MKKVIFIFTMLLSCTIFASNSLIKQIELSEIAITESDLTPVEINVNLGDDGCRVSCWGRLDNTETGETYYFSASAIAGDCLTAQINCYSDIYGQMQRIMQAPQD